MRQFIQGNDKAWQELEGKARGHCIRFKNQEMPPGCIPRQAHVGFEIDSGSGQAMLLVQNGVRYEGSSDGVRNWVHAGEMRFAGFDQLKAWVQGTMAQAFNAQTAHGNTGARVPGGQQGATPRANRAMDNQGALKSIILCMVVVAGLVVVSQMFNAGDQSRRNEAAFSSSQHQTAAPQRQQATPRRTGAQRPDPAHAPRATQARPVTPAPKPEPEWKQVVRDVSSFMQTLPTGRLQEEHQKITVTESTLRLHQEAAQFTIGQSRKVELEAMGQQRMHIVQLSDRIIATFRDLDRDFARVEQRVKNVSWDSAAERNSQVSRLNDYEDLKRRFLHPAQAMKAKYDR